MEEDDISFFDGPGDSPQTAYEKQLASLKTYIDSLPYECETVEQMQQALESIVEKIFIAAKAKDWLALSSWDGVLQCWLLMLYPIPRSTRAKLARLYYELCVLPGIEARVLRGWASMLSRLVSNKSSSFRKLEASDLQLPWKHLWRVIQKELWPKSSNVEPSRNLVNILLYVAEQCKYYYPPESVPEMLETFLPLLTQESVLTMVPVVTSFLPPTQTRIYLPALFKIWEAFSSSIMDDRLLEMCGDLAEEHVAGTAGSAGEFAAEWKEIGIWTQWQWDLITGKSLSSMNVPIGMMRGSSSNASQLADASDKQASKIKKSINRINAIAKIYVYSMSVDGEVRQNTPPANNSRVTSLAKQTGFTAGSRALDSLDKFINSTETYFHPSNTGAWTTSLTMLIQRLCAEFIKRYKEEELPANKVPQAQRLTPEIRREFAKILRTPALLGMFSKDPHSASYAQGALRTLAMLEPALIMPELLDRAYGGLEIVNETHRTTAVLSTLSGIARPLVTESIWLGGQKHLVPLLELCIPAIDLNDPSKTVCATMFIIAAIQHIKIGDLSVHQGGVPFSGDTTDDRMDVDDEVDHLPDGADLGETPRLSREDERSLVRDATSGFADWVVSLFRRVFALYENLPEEGGKKNTTGGKSEENVLKSIKSMLDVICLHLSDPLFDLVLRLVYDYATTNAKSNGVRAFGQLVACLAKRDPDKTIAKFMPFCAAQIEDELKHGASSVRTTSTHTAVPSDTTLHWNLAILRGCLGYGGPTLLKYKPEILRLLSLLVEKTKSERGYTSTGRLITRILNPLSSIYPLEWRFVNQSEWDDPNFDRSHNLHWGKLYEPKDVEVNWHVPSVDEIDFALEILDRIEKPALDIVESLVAKAAQWDNVARNDFCRYLHACRAVWIGLPTFAKIQPARSVNPLLNDAFEVSKMVVATLDVNCGFTLTDPRDPRYQKFMAYRERFGQVIHRAASILRQNTNGEDHTDAVITVTRAIDTYLLSYGVNRSEYDSLQKNYRQARELDRSWLRQKDNSRLVFLKRAQLYHTGRVYMHALYRSRSELDDKLLMELAELSLSPYTRIRRQAQGSLHNATGYFVRSTRLILPTIFNALSKGNDPDKMKGALYVLWNKGIAAYALSDQQFHKPYLLSLLECQHEEKPSVQKLVNSLANDCLSYVSEEGVHTDAYLLDITRVDEALEDLQSEFSSSFINQKLLQEVVGKAPARSANRETLWKDTISAVLEVALRPATHWRYMQMAAKIMYGLLRRDVPTPPGVARFFAEQVASPQPTIRTSAQKALTRLLYFIKIRTYSKSKEEVWFEEWSNPLKKYVAVDDPAEFLERLHQPVQDNGFFVDKIPTGFLTWTKTIAVYALPDSTDPIAWDRSSAATMDAIRSVVGEKDYMKQIGSLWGQESNKTGSSLDMRPENWMFVKSLAKIFQDAFVDEILEMTDSLITDADKFKQRAGAEFLIGVLRGSKHWPRIASDRLWAWTTSRLDRILAQIKPDTLTFWEHIVHEQLENRDPRRNQVLVDWILGLPLEFHGSSAFEMAKSLSLFSILLDALGVFFNHSSTKYVALFFNNANTDYAEIRQHLCHNLYLIMRNLWQPWHRSTDAFLIACEESNDPLQIRRAIYMDHISAMIEKLPKWREERLPPPRVNQSEYDKVGLTVLQLIWISAHGPPAHLIIPYIIPLMPEILRMSELNDSPDLQAYSSGVLYILSALTPLSDYVDPILDKFVVSIESSTSWRTRLHGLPALVIFFYRNLLSLSQEDVTKVMRVLLDCLSNENVEVREMASKVLSGVVRTSQRQSIIPLKNRFVALARKTTLPSRRDPEYATAMRTLHSAILGLCALIESFPYSVEPWMPPLTEVLAPHATDPPPISTTIRKCASEFKKTHQDTWHKDQQIFDEDQLQSLSTMLVGTSYYA